MPTLLRHPQLLSNISDPSSSLDGFLFFCGGVSVTADEGGGGGSPTPVTVTVVDGRWVFSAAVTTSQVGFNFLDKYLIFECLSSVFVESGDFINVWLVFLSNLVIFECLASVFVESRDFESLASDFESGDFGWF
ncbi:hypothetical protein Hanom_Chr16g01454381 [Helianthus anomalus]